MRGQSARNKRAPTAVLVGVAVLAVLALLVAFFVATRTDRDRVIRSDICATAEDLRASVDVSSWYGDPALAYADVPRFNEDPDPYQTVWMRRLERVTQHPRLDDRVSTYLRTLIDPLGPAPSSGRAQMLLWVAESLPADPSSSAAVLAAAEALQSGAGYAPNPGEAESDLATARVSLALALHGEQASPATIESLRSALRITPEGVFEQDDAPSREIQATVVRALALHDSLVDQASARAALDEAIATYGASEITPETISPLHSALTALRALGSPPAAVDITLSSDFLAFDGGWFGFAGASTPDPQLTFYIQAFGLGAKSIDLQWGAVESGWRSVQGASLAASGIWARISSHCGFTFQGDRAAIATLAEEQLAQAELSPQTALQIAHLIAASDAEFDADTVAIQLKAASSAAVESDDWIGVARLVSAADSLGVDLTIDMTPPSPSSADNSIELRALSLVAQHVGYRDAQAESAEKAENLERNGVYVYDEASLAPDIISTSFLTPMVSPAPELTVFSDGRYYCESAPEPHSDCNASLLAMAAGIESQFDSLIMWW